jgi:hypothetical protein
MTQPSLEKGTYELIRNRLEQQAEVLRGRLQQLNAARKEVFGSVSTRLIANDRIITANYCVARDIVALGTTCLLGYNVHVGLRSGIRLEDVFSAYQLQGKKFVETSLDLLANDSFHTDFQNLYRYYKEAYFARFVRQGQFLYMVFRLTPKGSDFKAFKWLVTDGQLQYVDNRSDQEVRYPHQYEFRWKPVGRDEQRHGKFPHVSILDRVFVETTGGDLTIKVEDNTDDGRGIYREPVEYPDQTLDDAEYAFADLGHLIVLRIRPYQEGARYFVFNEKMQQVQRMDALGQSGVLLPDNHGLIFPNGYYLQTGEYKVFEQDAEGLLFRQRIASPNGEDHLFVFYNEDRGWYRLLAYNVIQQEVTTPIQCNGFALFPQGELAYFRAEEDATKHHVIQLWQTPFTAGESRSSTHADSYLFKVGNKDIVRAMAECQEILTLTGKEDSYANLYDELVKRTTDVVDSYYWIDQEATFQLDEPLRALREIAHTAIEEYEKKVHQRRQTEQATQEVAGQVNEVLDKVRRASFERIDQFVELLARLRQLAGEVIGLQDLRYSDTDRIQELEAALQKTNQQLSEACVDFLLQDNALLPYQQQIDSVAEGITALKTAREAREVENRFDEISQSLELLIEIVSNLQIDDATQTTRIIDGISVLFSRLNQEKAAVRNKEKGFHQRELAAEFGAQMKLLEQSMINFLDLADSPDKCDDYLTKLIVQLEELESKFAEVEDFTSRLGDKREEIYNALERRKSSLVEARNNRTATLLRAGDRILEGIRRKAGTFKEEKDINSFFASDLMVQKVRDLSRQLLQLDDSNKANSLLTQLKTLKEEVLRGLRDRRELFVDGENVIQLGQHRFSVNVQPLELTVVHIDGSMQYHLTGTHFYEPVTDPDFLQTQAVWEQELISENEDIYRSEYLAYQLFRENKSGDAPPLQRVREAMTGRYQEGYSKGIHDEDAAKILEALESMSQGMGLLRYPPLVRAAGKVWWSVFLNAEEKMLWQRQLKSAGEILELFPHTHEFDYLIEGLQQAITSFLETSQLFPSYLAPRVAAYIFGELTGDDQFVCSGQAANLYQRLQDLLKKKKATKRFQSAIDALQERPRERFLLIRKWVHAYLEELQEPQYWPFQDEIAALLMVDDFENAQVISQSTQQWMEGMRGDHQLVSEGRYHLDYHAFMDKMERYFGAMVPLFEQFVAQKRKLSQQFRETIQLDSFKPRVLSSFVRNRLIDQVYLPLFGDNLAKQIGTAGENTRTDRMGLLLLLSPPGYGKTTLMEYVANRLGLIFMKINGPAIGHSVTSLAPADADSLAASKELEKLNLALEMGDNVMLYLDDIQHCHPEFLQKFISLCDAQRRIEGVYKGKAKTYDLRGRRICVVMAGNPYTESGERFRIPDMLANRADIYNLGDIIGDSAKAFRLSYLENALTSNPTLANMANRSLKDVYSLIEGVQQDQLETLDWEVEHSEKELADAAQVVRLLLQVRDAVLTVNQAYIRSAAMSDHYRTEPPFRLQGSYRNMNKLAEKIQPIMNEGELRTLLLAHYEGEVQTLTADAEANYLKLKEMLGWLSEEEEGRWVTIKTIFQQQLQNSQNQRLAMVAQMEGITQSLEGIRNALNPDIPEKHD